MMNGAATKVLIVDDDRLILNTLAIGLKKAGYQVQCGNSAAEAEVLIKQQMPDIGLFDIRMPGESGIELAERVRQAYPFPVIFLTAYDDKKMVEKAISAGAFGYLVKPVEVSRLMPAIETVLSRARELAESNRQRQGLESALARDRNIALATGILMERLSLSSDQAFQKIRQFARDRQTKIADVAIDIINALSLLNNIGSKADKNP